MIREPWGDDRPARPRVLVTRAHGQAGDLVAALRDAGLDPVAVPTIAVEPSTSRRELDAAAARLESYAWVVLTSANGARALLETPGRSAVRPGAPSWAVVGPATRRVVEREGIRVDLEPRENSATALEAEVPVLPGDRVLIVRGDLAGGRLVTALRDRGAAVDDIVAYGTREAPETSRKLLRDAMATEPISAVVFTSGSTIRGLVALGRSESIDVRSIPAVCIGPATADEARAAGFRILATARTPAAADVAATTAEALALQPQETR